MISKFGGIVIVQVFIKLSSLKGFDNENVNCLKDDDTIRKVFLVEVMRLMEFICFVFVAVAIYESKVVILLVCDYK